MHRYQSNGIPYYTFESLNSFPELLQAVSTRHGGVSQGPFSSLNLGRTVGDKADAVETNYQRLAGALGIDRMHLTTTWQVHGNLVLVADEANRGTRLGQADGIATGKPGVPLIQRYADCTPIILYDPEHCAVALIHAGWRGTLAGAAVAGVQAMVRAFGSVPEALVAGIGPAIGPCCYEVGPEVATQARTTFGSKVADSWLTLGSNNRPYFDLWSANFWQLQHVGVRHVELAGICTACHRDEFYSHRGDYGHTGRFAMVAMIK